LGIQLIKVALLLVGSALIVAAWRFNSYRVKITIVATLVDM
jgi:hypothetical protein